MSLERLFTEHPETVGETYWQHMAHAAGFGVRMVLGGICCLTHALLPFLFVTTGSGVIASLHDRMVVSRRRNMPEARSLPQEVRG
jgi:hypothetical protein